VCQSVCQSEVIRNFDKSIRECVKLSRQELFLSGGDGAGASLQIDLPQEDQVLLVTFPKKQPSGPSEQETEKESVEVDRRDECFRIGARI
jgi:hypothetical protein